MNILLSLSSLVRSLSITQCPVWFHPHSPTYFFGHHSLDWSPIIGEMFSRKLEKLMIHNEGHDEFLSRNAADSLIKVSSDELNKLFIIFRAFPNSERRFGYRQHANAILMVLTTRSMATLCKVRSLCRYRSSL